MTTQFEQLSHLLYEPPIAFTPNIFSKKKVTLNPTVSVHEISTQPMTKEEKSELYITIDDYNATILEVKAIALKHQQLQVQISEENNSKSSNCMGVVAAEAEDIFRGTESHLYPQRFQNRLVARRALIKYQTHLQTNHAGITPEQKAKAMRSASEKLSAWSQLVAQETARLDSLRAYHHDYLIPLDEAPVQFFSSDPDTLMNRGSVQVLKVGRVTPTSGSENTPRSSKNVRVNILPKDPPRPSKKARAAAEADLENEKTILTEISRSEILRSI